MKLENLCITTINLKAFLIKRAREKSDSIFHSLYRKYYKIIVNSLYRKYYVIIKEYAARKYGENYYKEYQIVNKKCLFCRRFLCL